ncbi:hypothetical protein DL766_006806 [Monosporascus sp. MC13-8B]|uniref:Rhodopsin domain-containing protein n=1 Tax=Monosporascus cannonballus TaxID=155416 RepID=A0ABY0GW21_9PEZI|nr:hypothetical protein DL762_008483 [Monosporascus cannonballus]RYO90987.1 hypothetical protein DL763_005158 [Monosporascus cannonballus]RYP26133.1 hypothetical protein DL766_006806 [Monosporascus sp. MC13-8B]
MEETTERNNGPKLIAALWPIAITSGIVLGLRIFAKISRGRYIWWDGTSPPTGRAATWLPSGPGPDLIKPFTSPSADITMLFSQTLLIVAVSLITKAVALGFGRPRTALDLDALYGIATYGAVYSGASTVIVASARVSFAVALLRVTLAGWGRVLVRVVIVGLVCVTAVPPVVARFTICDPFQKVYGLVQGGRCGNTYIPLYLGWASGAWSAASDFALTLLAWKIIWSMKMRPKEKVGVAIALSFGLLSGMITIFRYTYVALIYTRDFFGEFPACPPPLEYAAGRLTPSAEYGYFGFIWMAAKGATSIIAASIPALRAFVVERSRSSQGWRGWLSVSGGASSRPKSSAAVVTPRSSSAPGSSSPDRTKKNIHRHTSGPNDIPRGDDDGWDLEMSRYVEPASPMPAHVKGAAGVEQWTDV